ncbi:MAG: methyl-coenzyme M reductase operon protein D [Methanothrix soehngenii]|jgi:methyl-coenzyme M reductase subunit D|uniref:methyl-coenzyme M reductase operon protein D n=1 Tax=Methanothrix TaxID=2222 RepID=UPI0023F31C59|nr:MULTISPECIES: methyl-coenzyme M reductase operon protein D [Methanothrix]MCK9585925.1 methyl-coenzyme M reductase operon protein D [Methanothrix soehngenii]MDD3552691.1 methyl-coenzyme M reductase operon protein D [Methanothrix soehngenii]MDD3974286.1 methyl-coenzyme M reductase operon protein D [Methanothrix soehngenii]MDD4488471.1 methyl-coenzyme M reductase operon protein D [Methanothrix soehngenii]MDD5256261.1 methyl-coenzyme M reductase operon protein D [Methanothrix soehngenii]
MVTESDTGSIQVEIIPSRFLLPATAQKLLNEIYGNGGIIRITIHGPNLPRSVPYGPGRGSPIDENRDLLIEVGGQAFELSVKVGRIRLELESEKYYEGLKAACERALPISFQIRRGKFFHTRQTITDYAKYGKVEDTRILGLIDPKAKQDRLAILSEENVAVHDEER